MSEARKRVLKMLAEGKISVEQSEELLEALDEDVKKQEGSKGEKIGAEVKKMAAEMKAQVTEAFKKVEPHTKDVKVKLKELGGWIQEAVKGMMDDFSFHRMGPRDGLEVDFQVPEPEGFSSCREYEINVPHGSVTLNEGDGFSLAVQGKISKAALEGEPPLDWFKNNLLNYSNEKLFIGFDKASGFKAILQIFLTVPAGEVRVSSVSSDIKIRGAFSVKSISCISADVDVTGAKIENASLETVSGDIEIEDSTVSGKAKLTSGDFSVKRGEVGDLAVQTVSGDIQIESSKFSEGEVSLMTTSGDIQVKKPEGDIGKLEATTRTGDIQQSWGEASQEKPHELNMSVNERGANIRAETVSGDISFK